MPAFNCFIVALPVTMVFVVSTAYGQDSRYLGCFFDSIPNRVLPNLTFCGDVMELCNNYCSTTVPYCQSSTNMSVTTCLGLCSGKDFIFAGVQAGTQCFCGDGTAAYDINGEEDNEDYCKSNCRGDITQNCGSDFRMRVYEIGCLPIDARPHTTVLPANENFFEVGQTVSISCQKDFFATGPGNLTCLPLGRWDLAPPSCLPNVCKAPEPPPGTVDQGNTTQGSLEFRGGDTLAYNCSDSNIAVSISCIKGEWVADSMCPGTQPTSEPTTMMTFMVTEMFDASSLSSVPDQMTTDEATGQNRTNELWATNSGSTEFASSTQATVIHVDVMTTPLGDVTTLTSSVTSSREQTVRMLWLIIIVGAALFFFVVVLFIAIITVCRKKAERDKPINFQRNSEFPKIEDISQVNYAYEGDSEDQPHQNGRQTTGSPIRISTLHSQREITVNNNDNTHNYANPVAPAYTINHSGTVPNECSPATHNHIINAEARTGSWVDLPDIPEPDYDMASRESYVEVVTKL
ncbi:uncharacterized protein LOC110978773 [Acanthaster planci]|uniref:Uncharacterized protein LOC110978773 n=1 Tax=Acanthaster planci TaxID=133434 RepID=A0A8B7YBH7_ACAPL|nr:uncharacterized protein LOC110978773 [Acanthaster planci]